MPKIRNRNVTIFPHDFLVDRNENKKEIETLNEQIDSLSRSTLENSNTQNLYYSSDSDIESLSLDLNKLSGWSSSSSLSWSDECYEKESSKKVFDELKALDHVFRGEQNIPSHYDKDEIEEWMAIFPNLTIFDSEKTPVNSVLNLTDVDSSPKTDCDTLISVKRYNYPKLTVLESNELKPCKISSQLSPNLSKKPTPDPSKLLVGSNKAKSLDTEKYLRISPIKRKVNERKQSSRSLLNKQISRDDWTLKEYNSLPFIKIEELPLASSKLYNKKPNFQKSVKNPKRLILPPIIGDHFRSISAIPRQNCKTHSALSVNSNTMIQVSRKYSNSYLENPIGSRTERNNFLL